jgi:hypothetical protein
MKKMMTYTTMMILGATLAAAQTPAPADTGYTTTVRNSWNSVKRYVAASAEKMPADQYGFKPTPAQMSFGQIVVHLSQGNDYLCGEIGGAKAPTRTPVAATASKEALVARLKETFDFCSSSLATLDDSKLSEELDFFGGPKKSRAAVMTLTTGDWADHYSQAAIYMRLNGMLPPTAKKP